MLFEVIIVAAGLLLQMSFAYTLHTVKSICSLWSIKDTALMALTCLLNEGFPAI